MTTPYDACFRGGGGGSSAHAQNNDQQVLRVAPKRFLTEDEARHQQWKMIQVVHPRSTWASQDEERSTDFLADDDPPLVQPTILLSPKDSWNLGCRYLRARLHKKG